VVEILSKQIAAEIWGRAPHKDAELRGGVRKLRKAFITPSFESIKKRVV